MDKILEKISLTDPGDRRTISKEEQSGQPDQINAFLDQGRQCQLSEPCQLPEALCYRVGLMLQGMSGDGGNGIEKKVFNVKHHVLPQEVYTEWKGAKLF